MTMMVLYFAVFVGATAMSLVLVPAVREFARSREIHDVPGGHKSHTAPVPYLGGVAMVIAFSLAMVLGVLLQRNITISGQQISLNIESIALRSDTLLRELVVVIGLALIFSLMGLIDDLRGLSPRLRFAVGFVLASSLVAYGVRVASPLPDALDVVISVVWILGVTNAFNLLDNIDGLAAGTAAVAAGAFFFIAVMNDQQNGALFAIGLAGAMLGFLRSNFHPATIYMGDAGSLFIGFLTAYLGLKMRTNVNEIPQLFAPIVVLGVAVLDTTIVVVSRVRRGVSPFTGGQDHLSHRLRRFGLSVRRAVTTLLLASTALGVLAVGLSEATGSIGYWFLSAVAVSGVMATVVLTTKVARVEAPASTVNEDETNVTPIRRDVV
ncbi:MAG: glycosyltransferase family 4 protein [Ilumatobacteraceae bacterium]